ncbi:MAG: hypothetical protein L6Q37_04820 [Bdellovibrionaceae bacterium]|nr:hypothetical protein [Pseudobdellovibrionaceae bacterium]NUM60328.1 hypothetical protein [Pseudobdellovibrionaceae bacterium]
MNKKEHDEWIKEFNEFCDDSSSNIVVPSHLFEKIRNELFPNPWKVFSKIAIIHGVVGFLSLGICNQFGLNPFNTIYSLSDYFMKTAGHNFCMLACGVLFISTTYLFSNIFLTLEEVESVRKYEWLQLGVLSLASLASFYFFGAELVGTFVGLWLLGAVIGGVLSIELSFKIRQQMVQVTYK